MLITPLGTRIVVRYARKPIWMPTAPSKLFRITNHTFYSEEETKQIKKLNYAYKAQMQSVASYMRQEFYIPSTKAGGMPQDFLDKEALEERQLLEENDRTNAEVAKRKEKFLQERMSRMTDEVMDQKLSIEDALIEAGQKMDEFVKKSKSDPNSFVTPDNIEALIERAMDNPIDHEFCIDRQGRRINRAQSQVS